MLSTSSGLVFSQQVYFYVKNRKKSSFVIHLYPLGSEETGMDKPATTKGSVSKTTKKAQGKTHDIKNRGKAKDNVVSEKSISLYPHRLN